MLATCQYREALEEVHNGTISCTGTRMVQYIVQELEYASCGVLYFPSVLNARATSGCSTHAKPPLLKPSAAIADTKIWKPYKKKNNMYRMELSNLK